ncbi:MAG: PDZ domain-containing protein, partial [Actinobacteria bacterium]|nr:PDZ domain-containing protein [Actinomycetota bacterium]NIT95413.1 PDZ domain-containing protein [Actinomycetota bacterium]NIU19100.1 PDZ domain-containing protein [Actinomycetota bacterium]NIU66161.1 PDZ domain-containing protein [Actinomycetota bacterium]NIV55586.1 PDZ domain-containing protein [Actinomycetota bacterium]
EEETDLDEGGARVTHVMDDSPADRAGLRRGDVIIGFNGKTIRGPAGLTKQI